jgi:hypothetical protein
MLEVESQIRELLIDITSGSLNDKEEESLCDLMKKRPYGL